MKPYSSYLFLLCWILLAIIGFFQGWFSLVTPQNIKTFVLNFGLLAPVIFVVLFALTPFTPFFSAVLALASGLIFGFGYGSVLIMIGATCSSTVGFYLARLFSSMLHKEKNLSTSANLTQKLNNNGFWVVLVLRLIPIVPFDAISYMAGLSTIRYVHYLVATVLGMLPGVLVYANIGANTLNIYSVNFCASVALLVVLTFIALSAKKKMQKHWGNILEKS